jgi:hypothetical protein
MFTLAGAGQPTTVLRVYKTFDSEIAALAVLKTGQFNVYNNEL